MQGTLQVPLRGPAQPLAAVRSVACEAVLRKQSALTPVSSMAPSMAPTPLHGLPAPPLTVSCRVQPRKRKKKSKSGSLAALALCRPRSTPTNSRACQNTRRYQQPQESVRGGAVWVGRTVGAMDGAIEPLWTGLRRVLTTHTAPPSHAMPLLLWPLPLLRLVAGAGLQALPITLTPPSPLRSRRHCAPALRSAPDGRRR